MNLSDLGSVKGIEGDDLKAGSWFIFASPQGRHLALLLPIPVGHGGIRFVELLNYSVEPSLSGKLRTMDIDSFPSSAVFTLSNVFFDLPDGLSWLHPNPNLEPVRSLVKPGALLVTRKGAGLLVENREG